jgi:hypothetical protein
MKMARHESDMHMRLRLIIEAAENVIDNFAPPKGVNYCWDELRASIMLAKRDRKQLQTEEE